MIFQALIPTSCHSHYQDASNALPEFRRAVAVSYALWLTNLNGGRWYQDDQSRVRLELTPELIGLAISNNIEEGLIEKYGLEQGTINSAEMLWAMLDTGRNETGCGLSGFGVSVMDELFKSLSEMARDMVDKGEYPPNQLSIH